MKRKVGLTKRRVASVVKRQRERIKMKEESSQRRWAPEDVHMRFPTQADIMFGGVQGDYSRLDQRQIEMAERWKSNYLKAFDEMVANLMSENPEAELVDRLDSIRWQLVEGEIRDFLKGQDKYPEELSIFVHYDINKRVLNAERIADRWEEVLNA